MNQKWNLLRCVEKRQLEFARHVIRKEKIKNLALSGRLQENVQGGNNDTHLQKTSTRFSITELNYGKLHETELYGNPS